MAVGRRACGGDLAGRCGVCAGRWRGSQPLLVCRPRSSILAPAASPSSPGKCPFPFRCWWRRRARCWTTSRSRWGSKRPRAQRPPGCQPLVPPCCSLLEHQRSSPQLPRSNRPAVARTWRQVQMIACSCGPSTPPPCGRLRAGCSLRGLRQGRHGGAAGRQAAAEEHAQVDVLRHHDHDHHRARDRAGGGAAVAVPAGVARSLRRSPASRLQSLRTGPALGCAPRLQRSAAQGKAILWVGSLRASHGRRPGRVRELRGPPWRKRLVCLFL
jgi:hypothetical protein